MVRSIIAELDRIAKYLDTYEEPWSFNLVWRIDKIAQKLQEVTDHNTDLSKISKSVLNQYIQKMAFLTENKPKLENLIEQHKNKNASIIYNIMKKHFGDLGKQDSIDFINNTLKDLK